MHIYIIVIIVIVICILYTYNKESYTVTTDNRTGPNKDIGETYDYPLCNSNNYMCLTPTNFLKPDFKYNIFGDRCIHNTSTIYDIPKTRLDGVVDYTLNPSVEPKFSSCRADTNTMLSTTIGRYIRLMHPTGPLKLSHISVYDSNNNLITNSTIYTNILYTVPTLNHPDSILNSVGNVTFQTGVGSYPYIQIDLGVNKQINEVIIKHLNTTDALTLNGSMLIVLAEDASDLTNEIAIVKYLKINQVTQANALTVNRFNVMALVPATYPTNTSSNMNITKTLTMPCTGCANTNNIIYQYYKYNFDDRCYKNKQFNTTKQLLESAITGTISSSDLTTYFKSCSELRDTTIYSKYIHIPFTTSLTEVDSDAPCTIVTGSTNASNPLPFIDSSAAGKRGTKSSVRFTATGYTSSYLTCTNNNNLFKVYPYESCTIQFYMKILSGFYWAGVFLLGTHDNGIFFRPNGNADAFYANGSSVNITSNFITNKNEWLFICIIRDIVDMSVKLYVNETLITTIKNSNTANPWTVNPNNNPVGFGVSSILIEGMRNTEGFNGWISDFVFKKGEIRTTRYID